MIIYKTKEAEIKLNIPWLSQIKKEQIKCLAGVYGWYFISDGVKKYLYIGTNTDARFSSVTSRFLGELCGPQITTDKGKSLDTDFALSSCLGFLNEKGYNIYFEKLSDIPGKKEEIRIAKEKNPLLQKITEKRVCLNKNIKLKINNSAQEAFKKIEVELEKIICFFLFP